MNAVRLMYRIAVAIPVPVNRLFNYLHDEPLFPLIYYLFGILQMKSLSDI